MAPVNIVCLLGIMFLLPLVCAQPRCVGATTNARQRATQATSTVPNVIAAYFVEWGVYDRNYLVKDIKESGSAEELTHLLYAFADVTDDGKCKIYDEYAALQKPFDGAQSVDGTLSYGTFSQLVKLKSMYTNLKVLYSVGGWTLSKNFGVAVQNPEAFAQSCYDLMFNNPQVDPTLFDGIDIDWEYPNACGLTCDNSGPDAFNTLMQAVRAKFGDKLVTSAISGDGTEGGVIDEARFDKAKDVVDYFFVMTYDYFGPFPPYERGPTQPMAPLTTFLGIQHEGFYAEQAIERLTVTWNVPASMLVFGIPFYGRGWTGVTQPAPGGSATGPAMGKYESGVDDYKELINNCPATGIIAGTAYGFCGSNWWSYDTVDTTKSKVQYAKSRGLAGAFAWELSGDAAHAQLLTTMQQAWAEGASPQSLGGARRGSITARCIPHGPGRKMPIHKSRPGMTLCKA